MPTIHPGINEYLETLREDAVKVVPCDVFVKESITNAIIEGKKAKQKDAVQTIVAEKPSGISPMDRLKAKCNKTIIMDLELLMDEWCKSGDEVKCLSIYKSMQHYELPAAACTFVEEYLEKALKEITDAHTGASEYLAEAYSSYTKKQMLARIDALSSMLDDLTMFKTSVKAAKAPREKKPTAATKQIAKLQYLKHSEEFKITSINPIRVVGAYRLLAFNVKTRVLFDYVCTVTTGFVIKGTTIQNYDEVASRCIRLRKPDEFIPIAVGSTEKQLEKAWEKLTTKIAKPNGRINGDIVLLRIL
jgi:6,7-dimethyl-8-ribityllumazine synthase